MSSETELAPIRAPGDPVHARAGEAVGRHAPAAARDPQRVTALLVAGGHRSGTSAVTRALALLGAELPSHLLAANESNAAGYWESGRVVAFNEALLKEAGLSWMDLRPFGLPPSEARIDYVRALISEEFPQARRPIVKDPRLCRVAGPWIEALRREQAHVGVVIPVRDPYAVAASLLKRNSLRPAWGLQLWLRYVLDAERATRREARCFLRYERFMTDWRRDVGRIAAALDLDWLAPDCAAAPEVDGFLDPSLQSAGPRADALRHELDGGDAVREALEILTRWSTDGESASDHAALDRLRDAFDAGAEASQEALRRERLKTSAQSQATMALAAANASAARVDDLAQVVTALAERADRLETRLERSARRMARDMLAADRAAAARDALTQDRIAEIGKAIDRLKDEQAKSLKHLEKLLQHIDRWSTPGARTGKALPHDRRADRLAEGIRRNVVGFVDRLRAELRRRADLRLIASSALFDADWYLAQNPDVARSGMRPALHFLAHGGFEGRAPGPGFDPGWYLSAYPDVADDGMNPLVHYLRHGAREGRAPGPGGDAALPAPRRAPVAGRAAGVDPVRQRSQRFEPGDTPARVFSAGPPVVAAFDWVPDATPVSRVADASDPLAPLRALMIRGERAWSDVAVLPAGGGVVTGDLWIARADVMRLRIDREPDADRVDCVLRAHQLDLATGVAEPLGEWPICAAESGVFLDVGLRDRFAPILFTLSDAGGARLAEAVLSFPSLIRGGAHYGELCAIAPDAPYPTALERTSRTFAAQLWGAEPTATLACRRILVDLREANGAEPLFSTQALAWLSRLLGCIVEFERPPDMGAARWSHFQNLVAAPQEAGSRLAARRRAGGDLCLPADGFPTLSALSTRVHGTVRRAMGGLVLARDGGESLELIEIEGDHPDLPDLQPRHAGLRVPLMSGAWPPTSAPMALRFVQAEREDAAQLLCPVAPDLPGPLVRAAPAGPAAMTVVLHCAGDPRSAALALAALRRQSGIGPLEIIVHRTAASDPVDDPLTRALCDLFPDGFRIAATRSPGALAADVSATIATSTRPMALLLSTAVLLHDARTLEALQIAARGERVATAGCALFHQGPATKTSSGLALLTPIEAAVGAGDGRMARGVVSLLGPATVPAPGNDHRLAVLAVPAFRALGGFDAASRGLGEAMRAYCGRARSGDHIHVVTSVATATLTKFEDGDGVTGWPAGGAAITRLVA